MAFRPFPQPDVIIALFVALIVAVALLSSCCNCPQVNLKKPEAPMIYPTYKPATPAEPGDCYDASWPGAVFKCNPNVDKD